NLSGEAVYPVADILNSKNVPFAFITGYGTEALASEYANAPVLQKPVDQRTLQSLFTQDHTSFAKLACADEYATKIGRSFRQQTHRVATDAAIGSPHVKYWQAPQPV